METIIASGPVIIENGKVLLNKEKKDYGITPWLFPGGQLKSPDEHPEMACHREAKEEMGMGIATIEPLKTIELKQDGKKYILYHYLAERYTDIKPGKDVVDWAWHDINNLPNDCAPNVYQIIDEYKNMPQNP